MKRFTTKQIIVAAVFFAAIILATCLLRFDIPKSSDGGPLLRHTGKEANCFISFGDCVIYIAALAVGNPLAIIAAAVGSALADIFVGSAVYAIPSLIIKGAMAYLAERMLKNERDWLSIIKLCLYCSLIMIGGYFLFDLIIMNDYSVAALCLPTNVLQAIMNAAIAIPVLKVLSGTYFKQNNTIQG